MRQAKLQGKGLGACFLRSLGVCIALALVLGSVWGTVAAKTKIVWWGDVLDAKNTVSVIQRFEQLHPEYEVEYQQQGWPIDTKLATAIAAGAAPDVVLLDRFQLASWAFMDALEPLDALVKRDRLDHGQWFAGAWAETQFDGHTWGLPHSTDSRLMYYNVNLFDQVGLDASRFPRTWKELEDVSQRLTKRRNDGTLERLGFSTTMHSNWYFYGWLWADGGDIVDPQTDKLLFNSPIGRETLDWMVNFEDRINGGIDKVAEYSSKFGGYVGWGFYSERLAMQIQTPSVDKDIVTNNRSMRWAVAPVPVGPHAKQAVTWSGGFALSIPKGSRNAAGAWELAKFVCGDLMAQTDLGLATGWTPALVKAAHDERYLKISPNMPAFVAIMQVSLWRPVVPYSSVLSQILNDVMVPKATKHEMTVAAALDWAQSQLTVQIEKVKQQLQRKGKRMKGEA